jgi:hypothetical protein
MMFRWPGKEEGLGTPMNAEDAVEEFQNVRTHIHAHIQQA